MKGSKKKPRRFTKADERFIRYNYGKMPLTKIARLLKRHYDSVRIKTKHLFHGYKYTKAVKQMPKVKANRRIKCKIEADEMIMDKWRKELE